MGRRCQKSGYEHLEILASTWFHPSVSFLGCCVQGIVKVKNTITGETEEYFGEGEGKNIIDDEDSVILHGALFINKEDKE